MSDSCPGPAIGRRPARTNRDAALPRRWRACAPSCGVAPLPNLRRWILSRLVGAERIAQAGLPPLRPAVLEFDVRVHPDIDPGGPALVAECRVLAGKLAILRPAIEDVEHDL